jgi:calcineurin-like phosphoesterase
VLDTPKGRVAVIQAQGRSFMQPPLENPFLAVEVEAARLRADGVQAIFVDIHAETTSEKIALGWALDGKVSAVVGTHTHVQTADERILPGGTGCLTDAGMCGPDDSVLGRSPESVVWRFRTGMPTRFPIAAGPVRLCGVLVEVDPADGRCLAISRLNRLIPLPEAVESSSGTALASP